MVVIGGRMQPDYKAKASVVFTSPARKIVNGQEQPFKNQYANDTKTLAAAGDRQVTRPHHQKTPPAAGLPPRSAEEPRGRRLLAPLPAGPRPVLGDHGHRRHRQEPGTGDRYRQPG